ncbi:MAG: Outer rane lipoprotein SmpA [Gammaproteobacteria bacterium]|nr:Outer rane lipoprotein SmpA [Gammaproteobacteria bacterium]
MNRLFPLTSLILLLLPLGCSRSDGDYKLPGVYRIDIQQGNVIEQEMLDRLKPGMEKHQVRFIMGTPTMIDPFHPDRWEYLYTYTQGASQRQQRRLTLYFEGEKLAYLDGDVITSLRKPPENYGNKSRIVDVPPRVQRDFSLFGNIAKIIPFIGDDKPAPAVIPESDPASEQEGEETETAPAPAEQEQKTEDTTPTSDEPQSSK